MKLTLIISFIVSTLSFQALSKTYNSYSCLQMDNNPQFNKELNIEITDGSWGIGRASYNCQKIQTLFLNPEKSTLDKMIFSECPSVSNISTRIIEMQKHDEKTNVIFAKMTTYNNDIRISEVSYKCEHDSFEFNH